LNVFLIGSRGAGKSTVGKLLAAGLEWPFLDADVLLEARAGKTIREIFEQSGEAGFRALESSLLQTICSARNQVVATGGGVVLSEDNRRQMRAAGKVVWLTAEPETLWQRISADSSSPEMRPNLSVGGLDEVRDILSSRTPYYQSCAHHNFSTMDSTPEGVARMILTTLFPDRGTENRTRRTDP
jgi:shikimate kinase